jgi:hypothetical protein
LLGAAGLLLLTLVLGGAGRAEVRPVEAVGVVPLRADAPSRVPPRDAALQRALLDAVQRVAVDELPDRAALAGEEEVAAALGDDPYAFATRYRIREDRGERPALFTDDPEVESEYVVVVEVHVDVGRVRERLAAAGLLRMPSGDSRRYRVRVVIEDVESYAAYMAVRTLLEEMDLRSVLPLEMERGRAVIAVDGGRSPDQLMSALVRAAPSNLRLVPLGVDAQTLTLRASFVGAPAAPDPGIRRDRRPIDTPDPNRY